MSEWQRSQSQQQESTQTSTTLSRVTVVPSADQVPSRCQPGVPPPTPVPSHRRPLEDQRPLLSTFRNRSTPHLDALRSLSAAHEQTHRAVQLSALTAPSSPLASAAASFALAMSPVAQASATTDPLMPSDWTLDASAPTSPYTSLSRNASDYFDPALLAQLQSQNGSSHPELRANGRPDPSPPIDPVCAVCRRTRRMPVIRLLSQIGLNMQHTSSKPLICSVCNRLLATRSTPHLPTSTRLTLGTSSSRLRRMPHVHQLKRPSSRGRECLCRGGWLRMPSSLVSVRLDYAPWC